MRPTNKKRARGREQERSNVRAKSMKSTPGQRPQKKKVKQGRKKNGSQILFRGIDRSMSKVPAKRTLARKGKRGDEVKLRREGEKREILGRRP